MLITSTQTLKEYFKTFKNRLSIKTVAYGDYDRILTALKSTTTQYPLLWVERPRIQIIEEAGRKRQYTVAIVVAINTNSQTTYEQEDILITQCESILLDIVNALETEANEDTFEFDSTSVNIESFERTSGDMLIGSRAELKIIGAIDC